MSSGDSSRTTGLPEGLWLTNTAGEIRSRYGRLVYFGSSLDRDGRVYRNEGLSQSVGASEADRILRDSHLRAFDDWLCLNLEQQRADLDLYLSGIDGDARGIREAWVEGRAYRDLVPLTSEEAERQLFLADLDALADMVAEELGCHGRERVPPRAISAAGTALSGLQIVRHWLRRRDPRVA